MPRRVTFVTGMDRARQCLEVVPRLVRSKNRISISHLTRFFCTYNICMPRIEFEWEPRKAASNRTKHKVSFEEAATAFEDERALVIDDPEHSKFEERFVLLGMSRLPRVLVVVHCFRELHQKI